MRKPINLLSSIAAAVVLLAASPASAQPYDGSKIWEITCYSDSSHTTAVGYLIFNGCFDGQAYYRLVGTYTNYQGVEGPVGSCEDQ